MNSASTTGELKPAVRPWVRFWARHFDLAIAGTINIVLFGFIYSGIIRHKFIIMEISLVILAFMEATLLKFTKALLRTWLVILKGLGLEIPIVSLITLDNAHSILTTQGITSWDNKLKLKVTHKKIGLKRIILFVTLNLALLLIFFIMFKYYKSAI